MVTRRWVSAKQPAEIGTRDGLAYSLWLPDAEARAAGGVVILHGAGSCKENHHDFARAALGSGLAALAFDQRGHGGSEGRLDGRALDDVAAMAALLRERTGGAPIALRGSSMGGYLAIASASGARARAVVAICPASADGLRRGLARGAFSFEADTVSLDRVLAEHDLEAAVEALEAPLLILHADGDEVVPVEHSRQLARRMRGTASRLIVTPGGHHRSIQHDQEMQAASLRFIARALRRFIANP